MRWAPALVLVDPAWLHALGAWSSITIDHVRTAAAQWGPWAPVTSILITVINTFLPFPTDLMIVANGVTFCVGLLAGPLLETTAYFVNDDAQSIRRTSSGAAVWGAARKVTLGASSACLRALMEGRGLSAWSLSPFPRSVVGRGGVRTRLSNFEQTEFLRRSYTVVAEGFQSAND